MHMRVCAHAYMNVHRICMSVNRSQERALAPRELELQVVVNCPMKSCESNSSPPQEQQVLYVNYRAISPVPQAKLFNDSFLCTNNANSCFLNQMP